MKYFLGIVLCLAIVSSCKKENSSGSKVNVTFKLQTKDVASFLKSTKATGDPTAAAIIVSVQKYQGDLVYDREKLELTYLNGSYLSKAISMEQGGYMLTEFLVVDANNKVIYATPKSGSNLAYLISKPLPFYFDANSQTENVLTPEVIRTDSSSLEDLGYIGFALNYVKTMKVLINVLSKDSNQTTFEKVDNSHLCVVNDSVMPSKTYNFTLGSSVNTIYLNNDKGKYRLCIYKEGYCSWVDTLSKSQLENYSTTPLQVVLKPIQSISFTYLTNSSNEFYTGISIGKRNATDSYVDEGYGTVEHFNSKDFDISQMPYGASFIQVWGHLDDIKSIDIHGISKQLTSYLTRVDLSAATAIEDISFNSCEIDEFIINKATLKNFKAIYNCSVPFTFTDCPNLESITCTHSMSFYDIQSCDNLQSLDIPDGSTVIFGANPELTWVELNNYNGGYVSEDEVNTVLVNLLASVKMAPRAGTFNTYSITYGSGATLPTGDGLKAALILKNQYNWNIKTQ